MLQRTLTIPLLSIALLTCGVLLGCRSTSSSLQSTGQPDAPRAERIFEQIKETPDSLTTLPRPPFYRDSLVSPVSATAKPVGTVDTVSRAQITILGGLVNDQAQWGLHVRATLPDSSLLRPFSFVDLYSKKLIMRRGHAWRTLSSRGDSVVDSRFVPLSPKDLQRLARTDTIKLDMNHARFRLPLPFRSKLNGLYRAVPDSLRLTATGVHSLFTVYSVVDTEPSIKGEIDSFAETLDTEYQSSSQPGEAVVRFIVQDDGTVRPLETLTGGPPSFVAAVTRALRKHPFTPGRVNNQPVPSLMTVPITHEVRPGGPSPMP